MSHTGLFSLAGRTALVTGANTGIGQGIAVALATAGADIVAVGRSSPEDTAGMVRATGRDENKFCMACFNGKYPVQVNPELDKLVFERRRERAESLVFAEEASPRLFNGKI